MERKISITDPEAESLPFVFKRGESVRSKSDSSGIGKINDGWFEGDRRSGRYRILYEIEQEDGLLFFSDEMGLEEISDG